MMIYDLDPKDFKDVLENEEVVLIDVRTSNEFLSGRIPGAINCDVTSPNFLNKMARFPKHAKILLYCQSGGRSKGAGTMLVKAGYEDISHLSGGIIAWGIAKYQTE